MKEGKTKVELMEILYDKNKIDISGEADYTDKLNKLKVFIV